MVLDKLQGSIAGVADNREHRLEGSLETDVFALLGALAILQKGTIRIDLDGKKVGDVHKSRQFAEILADTFLLGV